MRISKISVAFCPPKIELVVKPAICRDYNKIIRERDSTLAPNLRVEIKYAQLYAGRPVNYSVYRAINFCKRLCCPFV